MATKPICPPERPKPKPHPTIQCRASFASTASTEQKACASETCKKHAGWFWDLYQSEIGTRKIRRERIVQVVQERGDTDAGTITTNSVKVHRKSPVVPRARIVRVLDSEQSELC